MINIKTKNEIRSEILKERNKLTKTEIDIYSKSILDKITAIDNINEYKNILLYFNIRSEVSTSSLTIWALMNDKNVYFPKVNKINDENMDFYKIKTLDDFEAGYQNIPEPNDKCEKLKYPFSDKSLIIVPGSVFDENGYRIGYGKGFYDKYLADKDIFKIGICYDFQLLKEIPHDNFDVQLDLIITNERTITINQQS